MVESSQKVESVIRGFNKLDVTAEADISTQKQQPQKPKPKEHTGSKGHEFDGLHFALTGTFSMPRHTMERLIEEHGGVIVHNATGGTNFVIGSEDSFRRFSKKIKSALENKVPIVAEDYIRECIKKGSIDKVDHHFYLMSKEDFDDEHLGEVRHKQKVRKPDPDYETSARVEKDDMDNYYDIKLINKLDNRECRMQIMHDHGAYNLFIKYGHIGGGGVQKFGHAYKKKEDAVNEFISRFERKTKNSWDTYLDGRFLSVDGEYTLDPDYIL